MISTKKSHTSKPTKHKQSVTERLYKYSDSIRKLLTTSEYLDIIGLTNEFGGK